ncbi:MULTISPECIES: hypothetical protein [Pseudomonas]|uniref:Uncharacterized protein n=1 Tax=Pseudomonas nitroreducens TaxID=46680 RepID=A0A6G6J883_PSENT|nr:MULTISPECIES: hypothetical protein [Pseudomonas]MDU4254043.1 hypothetical protein [Pseudomonas sp.]QIE91595.1 hypothetical protein G5B91_35290 [Pseudomonas nitroreducens]
MPRPNPAKEVEKWNNAHQVGASVDYRSFKGAEPKRTVTTSPAQVLGGHTAVVFLEGISGSVAISHCTPA